MPIGFGIIEGHPVIVEKEDEVMGALILNTVKEDAKKSFRGGLDLCGMRLITCFAESPEKIGVTLDDVKMSVHRLG